MAGHPQHQTTRGWETERLIPDSLPWHKKRMLDEHIARYEFACTYVKRKSVVDLACGTGYGCYLMAEAGATKVTGIDISTEAIRYANKHFPHPRCHYYRRDVTTTLLPDHSVDIITSFETIEHLAHDVSFIEETRRLLKPHGLLIISTPNKEFSVGTNPYHIREYTFNEFEELLRNFSRISLYGQRKVIRPLFRLMQRFPRLTSFRPWESTRIKKISKRSNTNFCYFLFVCTV